jgi:hypothetical protein
MILIFSKEHSISPWIWILVSRLIASTFDIIRILMSWIPRPIFITYTTVLISQSCSGRCYSPLTWDFSTSALFKCIWKHFWYYVFSLSNLGAILKTVCLLNKKHISMIMRSLYNFRSCSSIFNIDSKALVWLWTLWTKYISVYISTYSTNYSYKSVNCWISL